MAYRGGRKPDSVIALERGTTVEEVRRERGKRLTAKKQSDEVHSTDTSAIDTDVVEATSDELKDRSDFDLFMREFDPKLNDIAAAIQECRERLERLSNTKMHEKKLDFLCEEFVSRIKKLGYDEAIVLDRLKKLLGAE